MLPLVRSADVPAPQPPWFQEQHNPLTWNSEFMSATCSLISSRRSAGVAGKVAICVKRAHELLCGLDERRARQ